MAIDHETFCNFEQDDFGSTDCGMFDVLEVENQYVHHVGMT
jgi:hypothetical protein